MHLFLQILTKIFFCAGTTQKYNQQPFGDNRIQVQTLTQNRSKTVRSIKIMISTSPTSLSKIVLNYNLTNSIARLKCASTVYLTMETYVFAISAKCCAHDSAARGLFHSLSFFYELFLRLSYYDQNKNRLTLFSIRERLALEHSQIKKTLQRIQFY